MINVLLHALGWLATLWAAGVLWLTLGAWWLRHRLSLRAPLAAPAQVSNLRVLLIRPCAGNERTLRTCLASVERMRFSCDLEIVIAVDDPQDAALVVATEVARKLRAARLCCSVEVVPRRDPNRKVGILHGVSARHLGQIDVVVNADSNVDLEDYNLDTFLSPLLGPKPPGAVWGPHAEHTDISTLGARASCAVLNGSLHSFPLLCALDPQGLVGKLFAVRAQALAAVGGFAPLLPYLGEDMELSRRLRESGFEVQPAAAVARSLGNAQRIRSTVARHARWMAVIRAQRPALLPTFPLFFCPTPLIIAAACVSWSQSPALATISVGLSVVGRLMVAALARHFSGFKLRLSTLALDALLADLVLLVALLRALTSYQVRWRGMRLLVVSGGRIKSQ